MPIIAKITVFIATEIAPNNSSHSLSMWLTVDIKTNHEVQNTSWLYLRGICKPRYSFVRFG